MIFKKETGKTIGEYKNDFTFSQIRSLLAAETISVGEISETLTIFPCVLRSDSTKHRRNTAEPGVSKNSNPILPSPGNILPPSRIDYCGGIRL